MEFNWELLTEPHMDATEHRRLILEQFTQQAVPFARMPIHNAEESNRLVLDAAAIGPDDDILDVACGPGLITMAAARRARSVTGLDLTPAMLEEARKRQHQSGLTNLTWIEGDVESLPFPAGQFSVVMTRYSVHHFPDPTAVLREMVRVCRDGGRVMVVDVITTGSDQATTYDFVERLRDPSHVHALSLEEFGRAFQAAGIQKMESSFYRLETDLEELLEATRTPPGPAHEVRELFRQDLKTNALGLGTLEKNGRIRFAFPIAVLVGRKA
jgi:ubiquinone/menaquinone biosynthesis C-methylase UbiE